MDFTSIKLQLLQQKESLKSISSNNGIINTNNTSILKVGYAKSEPTMTSQLKYKPKN